MKKINFVLLLTLLVFSTFGFADSTQYAGFKEWKSPNLGIESQGDSVEVANVDNDSDLEIIAIAADGTFRIFEYDGSTYQQQWSSPVLAATLDDLTIGDFDNDGTLEIAVSTLENANTKFYIFGFDGSTYQLEWTSPDLSGADYLGLSLYTEDTDNDTIPEIVITSDEGGSAYGWIYDYNGSTYVQAWASGLLDTYDVLEYSGFADTDADGVSEIVFTGERIYVFGWNGSTYQSEWQSSVLSLEQCVLGNVDTNSDIELVAFTERGTTRVYGYNGSTYVLEWESADINASYGVIGDVDNDGIQEIVTGTYDGDVYIFEYNGSTYQQQWFTTTSKVYTEVEIIEDLDGSGGKEILISGLDTYDPADWTGYCAVYTYSGGVYQLAWSDEIIDSYFGGFYGPSGDVDNDGIPEEVRYANNQDRYYPYSIYVMGPAKQMPNCSSPLEGDVDGNCEVNLLDLSKIAANWLQCNLVDQGDCSQ